MTLDLRIEAQLEALTAARKALVEEVGYLLNTGSAPDLRGLYIAVRVQEAQFNALVRHIEAAQGDPAVGD